MNPQLQEILHQITLSIKNEFDKQDARIKMLEEECAALRKQLISACNELMEIKR